MGCEVLLSACLSVFCLSVRSCIAKTAHLHFTTSSVAVARSFSDGITIHYLGLLSVLWTTSYFHIIDRIDNACVSSVRQVAAPGTKSALSPTAFCFIIECDLPGEISRAHVS